MGDSSSLNTIKVVIVDDHSLFRKGVRSGLEKYNDIEVIAEAENGVQLLEILTNTLPDVILLDIQMPVMDGMATLPELKRSYPFLKVIMLSMHNDHSVISRMMEIGANSYLTKESGGVAIYTTIKTVFYEGFCFNDLTNKALLNGLRTNRYESSKKHLSFTEKEIDILRLTALDKTVKEIADEIDLSPRTVDAVLDKLKTKANVKSLAGLVMFAIKTGLVTGEENNQNSDKVRGRKIALSNEQIIRLFGLSTSILEFINHDLSGQRNAISNALEQIREYLIQSTESKNAKIHQLLNEAIDSTYSIDSITNIIRQSYYKGALAEDEVLSDFFVSPLADIIQMVEDRHKDAYISINSEEKNLVIVYPSRILFAIFSELVENAKRAASGDCGRLIIDWRINGSTFQCEVHDNGKGFDGIEKGKFVPVAALPVSKTHTGGRGLRIIERTIMYTNGHFLIGNSQLLEGGVAFFEFPIINFYKK